MCVGLRWLGGQRHRHQSWGAEQPRDHRTTLEHSVEQRGDPEGYGQKQHHPPEEDGRAEENDRHLGRGYGEGHRI